MPGVGTGPPAHPGNPTGGRPKKTDDMRAAETLMRSRSEQGAKDLIELSETSPDHGVRERLLRFRWEACFGKAPQAITGAEGEPLIPPLDLSRLTDEQLRAIVAVGRAVTAVTGDAAESSGDASGEGEGMAPGSAP